MYNRMAMQAIQKRKIETGEVELKITTLPNGQTTQTYQQTATFQKVTPAEIQAEINKLMGDPGTIRQQAAQSTAQAAGRLGLKPSHTEHSSNSAHYAVSGKTSVSWYGRMAKQA